jgi:inner membrane protein
MDWLDALSPHWFWLSLGLILGAAEIILPGFFLIWLAGAAIVTGVLVWVLPIPIAGQVGLFAVLAIVMVYAAKSWMVRNPGAPGDPLLNHRAERLVGETVTVVEALDGGRGRVKVGDSVWMAKGADAPIGARLRVTGSDSGALLVEAA